MKTETVLKMQIHAGQRCGSYETKRLPLSAAWSSRRQTLRRRSGFWPSIDPVRQRKAKQRSSHTANHDGLTGLANRTSFLNYAEVTLQQAERHNTHVAVVMLNLDGFKYPRPV
ncbi:hypothetical protein GCM10008955_40540 [Deinococcus malanensis]|uniref:GGDEF domain-containing protein n=1 Tax=Deinococcus malanensis TaxID=1706855 RepID=A0ABQ2F5S5_9DEIO|nr:GGDEF domain-containing protein [Deinococcus malanensis]GGK42675.1 hypothetical protein GCM10008955_40540 [Deinococcus malanensis]